MSSATTVAPTTVDAEDHGHRLLGGDRRVAVRLTTTKTVWLSAAAERQAEPERVEPDPGRRVELRGDDGDHAGERERRARRPRGRSSGSRPERDVRRRATMTG